MLENLKEQVLTIAKRAQRDGLCKHKSGNFSIRDTETGYVVITPTGVDREKLEANDICVIDLEANVIENLTGLKPTSESLMHLNIYKTRKDVNAVAHTHSMYATSFAVLNKAIPAIVYECANMGLGKGRIPVAPFGRPGTVALADSIVDACTESNCFLLEKHGAVSIDTRNLYEAYLNACYIEELAQLYYISLTANANVEPDGFPAEELQKWAYPKEIKFK
jgi:L-fuculose-phosphate aldolase